MDIRPPDNTVMNHPNTTACCADCGTALTPVFDADTRFQLAGALWIGLHGGYGMFVDEMTDLPGGGNDKVLPGNPDVEAVLCSTCATRLVQAHPWLDRLVNPPEQGTRVLS